MSAHAVLSPSGASRWLACPPSARLEQQFPDTTSEAAAEGTLAHALGEAVLLKAMADSRGAKIAQTKAIARLETHELFNETMRGYAQDYAAFIVERLNGARTKTPDAVLLVEQRLNISDYVPEGFGTGDAVIIADGVMEMIDLKYGKGVKVEAENNAQMKLYALGALREFDFLYDIADVRLTIYQPRLDNISSWELSVDALRTWAEDELRPQAKLAYEGQGEFTPGEHCRFCRAKALCKANAEKNLELAKYDFANAELLTDQEISDVLSRGTAFKKWIDAVEAYALREAADNGKLWPGFKLVEGRSVRQYQDPDRVADALTANGVDEAIVYERKLLGITAMEKALGAKTFDALLSDLLIKPPGKPTLVPLTDKRPAIGGLASAKQDFSEQ